MSFLFNVVTNNGSNLIAQATAANPIVLIGALSSENAATSLQDLGSKDASFYTLGAGSIFAASATDNVARVIMRFDSGDMQLPTPKILKSACILGRLASQDDSQAVIMAALSDPDSQVQIPDYSGVVIDIPISVTINADDQVETIGGEYASLADLERFVSMYKAGNPTEGEDQSILGNKNFLENVRAGKVSSPLVEASKTSTNEIEPITNSGTIGFSTKFDYIGCDSIHTNNIICYNHKINMSPDGGGCDLTFDVQATGGYNTCEIKATSEDGNESGYIQFSFGGGKTYIYTNCTSLRPSTNLGCDLGSTTYYWDNGYIRSIQADSISTNSVTANNVSSNSIDVTGTADIGTLDVDALKGLAPSLPDPGSSTSVFDVPIGGIICAIDTSWTASDVAGSMIVANYNTVFTRGLDGSYATSNAIPPGKYKLLSHGHDGQRAIAALLLRIE